MRKMMRKIASMRKMMRKIIFLRKMMRKIAFMLKMIRKRKISTSEGEYSRSEQHKTFECHLLVQDVYCLSN